MKNETLYNKTVNILVDAYFNDTLVHCNCYGCAVGNLVAANMGLKYVGKGKKLRWRGVKSIYQGFPSKNWIDVLQMGEVNIEEYDGVAKMQIDATGYTPQELARIEHAFENEGIYQRNDQTMFNGLMAVIEVLDQIHENTDQTVTQSSKQKFVKA